MKSWPSRRNVYRMLARGRRVVVRNVLRADDPPHKLALGVAIGLFVTFTPTIGFQSAMVIVLAWMFGANKLVGLPLVWISNPATFIPIYYPCYRLGRWVLGGQPVSLQWWKELARAPDTYWEATRFYWKRLMEIIEPLTVGCLLVAIPIAGFGYVFTFQAVVKYRKMRGRPSQGRAADSQEADSQEADSQEADSGVT